IAFPGDISKRSSNRHRSITVVPSSEVTVSAPLPQNQLALAVTMGDPAGIGPDLALLSWCERQILNLPVFFVVGDVEVMRERASALTGTNRRLVEQIERAEQAIEVFSRALPVLGITEKPIQVVAGKPDMSCAPAIIASIEAAAAQVVEGRASALVT